MEGGWMVDGGWMEGGWMVDGGWMDGGWIPIDDGCCLAYLTNSFFANRLQKIDLELSTPPSCVKFRCAYVPPAKKQH